jgi:hypothetical protein
MMPHAMQNHMLEGLPNCEHDRTEGGLTLDGSKQGLCIKRRNQFTPAVALDFKQCNKGINVSRVFRFGKRWFSIGNHVPPELRGTSQMNERVVNAVMAIAVRCTIDVIREGSCQLKQALCLIEMKTELDLICLWKGCRHSAHGISSFK